MATFENSGVTAADLDERHYIAENTTASLSECAQYCYAGSGEIISQKALSFPTTFKPLLPFAACDMFEFDKNSATCRFMPHTALKSFSWASYTLGTGPTERKSVFILQCASVMDNLAADQWVYLTSAVKSAGVTIQELELEETSRVRRKDACTGNSDAVVQRHFVFLQAAQLLTAPKMIRFAGLTGAGETVTLGGVSIVTTPALTSYINTIRPGGIFQMITQGDGYSLSVGVVDLP